MDFYGFPRTSVDFHGFLWIFFDFHRFSWIFVAVRLRYQTNRNERKPTETKGSECIFVTNWSLGGKREGALFRSYAARAALTAHDPQQGVQLIWDSPLLRLCPRGICRLDSTPHPVFKRFFIVFNTFLTRLAETRPDPENSRGKRAPQNQIPKRTGVHVF